jgi:hypothetical protein
MSQLVFRLRSPDGRVETLTLEADRAMIGSGAHCEIRLPPEHAAVEHVFVQATGAGVYGAARSFDPPPMAGGVPFMQGPVLPDVPLVLGRVEVFVAWQETASGAAAGPAQQQKTSPMTIVLALLMVPLAAYVLLWEEDEGGVAQAPKDVPALFAQEAPPCPQREAPQAEAFAVERFAVADGKRERSPFDVKDGVAAVPLYDVAAACFKVGGDGRSADEARAASASLRAKLTEDYRTHLVWLDRSLGTKDFKTAQREVAILLAYTEGKKSEWVTWLSNLDRQLRVKYGKQGP